MYSVQWLQLAKLDLQKTSDGPVGLATSMIPALRHTHTMRKCTHTSSILQDLTRSNNNPTQSLTPKETCCRYGSILNIDILWTKGDQYRDKANKLGKGQRYTHCKVNGNMYLSIYASTPHPHLALRALANTSDLNLCEERLSSFNGIDESHSIDKYGNKIAEENIVPCRRTLSFLLFVPSKSFCLPVCCRGGCLAVCTLHWPWLCWQWRMKDFLPDLLYLRDYTHWPSFYWQQRMGQFRSDSPPPGRCLWTQ